MNLDRTKELLNKYRYSNMLGIQCDRSKEELEEEKKEYQEIEKKLRDDFEKRQKQLEFVVSQINSIEYGLKSHKRKDLNKVKPTKEHKLLIRNMTFQEYENGGDYVFIGVNGKRPFGNSNVYRDIAEILGWKLPNSDLSDAQEAKAARLLEELPYALNNLLQNV